MKKIFLSLKQIHIATMIALFSLVVVISPGYIQAGETVIEEGAVFSDTFVKDGRRVEVTKTYTRDGVTIHQKIYDDQTGNLIREKTTVNPIKDNVRLVSPGSEGSQDGAVVETKETQPNAAQEELVENKEDAQGKDSDEDDISDSDLEEKVGLEVVAKRAQERYQLYSVEKVYVDENDGETKVSIEATRKRKLLGFFPVDVPTKMIIDAQTTDIIKHDRTLWVKIIEALSS